MSRRRRILRRLRRWAPFAVGYHLGRLDGQVAAQRWQGGPIRVG
jgi:hypothetical protein